MNNGRQTSKREQGSVLLIVCVFVATAIAGLAAISSGRVVYASRSQLVMESETRAVNSAYAQIHMAMNVVNNSAYDEQNHNLVLQGAVAGLNGGTASKGLTQDELVKAAGTSEGVYYYKNGEAVRLEEAGGETTGYIQTKTSEYTKTIIENEVGDWLDHKDDPPYGLVASTNVRVYRARDYISRLQRLKGEQVTKVDPGGLSDSYYVIEAAGRVGDTIRLVSALVRENEPFSSFVFFQNRATLGLSGSPRGLTHANEKIEFYFPNGNYVDAVSAVDGFGYMAGATAENTSLRDANPAAQRIDLKKVDFEELKGKADVFVGDAGLDAEIELKDKFLEIKEFTPPRYEKITRSYTYNKYVGYHYETYETTQKVKVGEEKVPYDAQVVDYYDYVDYWVTEKVQVGTKTETKYKDVKVQVGTKEVTKTKQEPVYEMQTVTKQHKVKKWVAYNEGEGGTTVSGGGAGALGEYVWVTESYQTTEQVQVGTKTVTFTVTEPVYEWQKQPYAVTTKIFEDQSVKKTKKVAVYKTITKYKTVNIYEEQTVEKKKKIKDYEKVTYTYETYEFHDAVEQRAVTLKLPSGKGGTVYIDGRVTRLRGDLNGRLTIVGNEKVRIDGNIKYMDDNDIYAMVNGSDYTKPYQRNSEYTGRSVLGVIARGDIVMTSNLDTKAEINATLMSVDGRVGIDGFLATADGELVKETSKTRKALLSWDDYVSAYAYDRVTRYRTKSFVKESLRRIGGVISNNRIMETYITAKKDGTSKVTAGFKRGNMTFDINLLFNPPPNFVVVPRPVLTYFVPIMMVRNHDS